eukprot:8635856-Pyramimonas_sp.AAC.1
MRYKGAGELLAPTSLLQALVRPLIKSGGGRLGDTPGMKLDPRSQPRLRSPHLGIPTKDGPINKIEEQT